VESTEAVNARFRQPGRGGPAPAPSRALPWIHSRRSRFAFRAVHRARRGGHHSRSEGWRGLPISPRAAKRSFTYASTSPKPHLTLETREQWLTWMAL